ncbi:glycosyltransferase [Sphingomonas sp. ac-8]|uniref:glycosyltransferase n=1 Tax=Sphingomonas sp. ac-8 TaxID=3242977 RepID=UPI003A80A861
MRIVALNIRATQGGAGRAGYDLHHRLRAAGHDMSLLYGYGSGIAPDPAVAGEPDVAMLGSRAAVLANYAAHLLIGREAVLASAARLRAAVADADVVHLHAAHHWYLHWTGLMRMLADSGKPVVLTAHDWWLVSGRCAIPRDCTGWRRGCGECGPRRFEDLPVLVDRSRAIRRERHAALRLLGERLTLVCPSHHLARDHRMALPDLRIARIANALDREFERALAAATPESSRRGHLFCAADLCAPGKIDAELVRALLAEPGISVALVGRGDPCGDPRAVHHGEVRSRDQLAALYRGAHALLFTSQMDNAPLTILEALSAGCYVVAYASPAAQEMLAEVGGRCVHSAAEALAVVRAGREAALYGGISPAELARRARRAWSGAAMTQAYLGLYAAASARTGAKRAA